MNIIDGFRLSGRVCIVTGGAGLYGKPIASALAEAGGTVVIASRKLENCTATADELVANGYKAAGMALDLADEKSIEQFVAAVVERFGAIDVLVNNAVSRLGFSTLDDIDKDAWE